MKRVRIGLSVALLAALGSCAPRPEPAPPVAAPTPRPQPPRPAPTPPPPPANWQDAPLSPGGWTYRSEGAASSASFGAPGQPGFVVRCEPSRQITLARTGATAAPALTIRTSYSARSFPARAAAAALATTLSASDPFLDAIAFSRGRFTVEAAGLPTLILPAWPEPARVIEDCRS
jgi:hypothetical protein